MVHGKTQCPRGFFIPNVISQTRFVRCVRNIFKIAPELREIMGNNNKGCLARTKFSIHLLLISLIRQGRVDGEANPWWEMEYVFLIYPTANPGSTRIPCCVFTLCRM